MKNGTIVNLKKVKFNNSNKTSQNKLYICTNFSSKKNLLFTLLVKFFYIFVFYFELVFIWLSGSSSSTSTLGGTIVARGLSFGVPGANVIRYDNGTTEWFGHMAVGGSFEIGGTGNHRMYDGKFKFKNKK